MKHTIKECQWSILLRRLLITGKTWVNMKRISYGTCFSTFSTSSFLPPTCPLPYSIFSPIIPNVLLWVTFIITITAKTTTIPSKGFQIKPVMHLLKYFFIMNLNKNLMWASSRLHSWVTPKSCQYNIYMHHLAQIMYNRSLQFLWWRRITQNYGAEWRGQNFSPAQCRKNRSHCFDPKLQRQ